MKRLRLNKYDSIIAGVCGGIADYYEIDSTILRLCILLLGIYNIVATCLIYTFFVIVMKED